MMNYQLRVRELTVAEILGKSFKIYFSQFEIFLAPFLLSSFANTAIREIIMTLLPPFNLPESLSEGFFLYLIDYLSIAIPVFSAFLMISWVINTLSSGIATACSYDVIEGRIPNLKTSLAFILSKIWPLLAVGFITGVLTVIGFILLIIPGVLVAIMFSLSIQIATIEQVSATLSLQRSKKLVADRWGKVFAILLSTSLIIAVMYVIGSAVGKIIGVSNTLVKGLIESVFVSLAQPLQPLSMTCLYHSLRMKEIMCARREVIPPVSPPQVQTYADGLIGFHPRFCYKCGQKLTFDAVYCPQCGVRVRS